MGFLNKTIISLGRVGYEMIIANSYPPTRGIIVNFLYVNINDIPGESSRENILFSHVNFTS